MKSGSIKMWVMLNCFNWMLINGLETTLFRDGMVDYRIQAGPTFIKSVANFSFQPYLEKLTIPKYRISVFKLRVSSHRLYVETGRWRRTHSVPYHERKCHICNVLDDEYHFVLECRMLNDLRTKYIPSTFRPRICIH